MKTDFVKVAAKMTPDTFGCPESYFKKYIKGRPLQVIHETPNHYVRVQDQNQEEWGLFNHQYTLVTGLGLPPAPQEKEASQKNLLRPKAG